MWNGALTDQYGNIGIGTVALQVLGSSLPILVALAVECPFWGTGDHGFDPEINSTIPFNLKTN